MSVRVCSISDVECARGCGTGACKQEENTVTNETMKDGERESEAYSFFIPNEALEKMLRERESGSMTSMLWEELQKFRVDFEVPRAASPQSGEVDFSDGEARNAYYAGFKEGEASAAETQSGEKAPARSLEDVRADQAEHERYRHWANWFVNHEGHPMEAVDAWQIRAMLEDDAAPLTPSQWADVYYFARAVELAEFLGRVDDVFTQAPTERISEAAPVNPEWLTCETRGPMLRNSLQHRLQELRSAANKCRSAYTKEFMGAPTRWIASVYDEAANVLEKNLGLLTIAARKAESKRGEGEV